MDLWICEQCHVSPPGRRQNSARAGWCVSARLLREKIIQPTRETRLSFQCHAKLIHLPLSCACWVPALHFVVFGFLGDRKTSHLIKFGVFSESIDVEWNWFISQLCELEKMASWRSALCFSRTSLDEDSEEDGDRAPADKNLWTSGHNRWPQVNIQKLSPLLKSMFISTPCHSVRRNTEAADVLQ